MILRAAGRAACVLAASVAFLPLVAFLVARPPLPLLPLAACLLALTLARPRLGWLALLALFPFGDLLGRLLASRPTATEPLVLAFLCGWFLREAIAPEGTGEGDEAPGDGRRLILGLAALLALGVASSLAVQLAVIQAGVAFPLQFLGLAWRFMWHDYYANGEVLAPIGGATFVLEGLGLFAATVVLVGRRRQLALAGIQVFAGAAALVAAINGFQLVRQAATATTPSPIRELLAARVSYVFGDLNAAGSYFVLALFVAGSLAVAGRRCRRLWRGVALLILLGVVLAGSRTAFGAAWMAAAFLAWAVRRRSRAALRMFLPAILALGVLAVVYAAWSPRSNPLDMETGVRWRREMLATSLRVAREYPVFGVGAGRFYEGSARFRSGEFVASTQPENAHNNFLQVLAELGGVGLTLLVGLLGVVFRRSWPLVTRSGEAWVAGLAGGLVAFIATWLTGHPLLVREVSLAFWVALGLLAGVAAAASGTAGDTTAGTTVRRRRWLPYAVVALVIVALVPVMAERRLARADLSRDGQGLSVWHATPDGIRFRWMLKRAVLYVPASATEVAIGFRSPGGLATVRVMVDGKQAAQVVVGDLRWEEVRIAVPPGSRWASVPVLLQVRGTGPTGAAPGDAAAERRVQVALPQVLSTRPPTKP